MSKTETTDAGNTAAAENAENEADLGAAGSQLSTAPREEPAAGLPAMGVIGWARWFWRQLTSMRIALLLLLLLSLGAIPGSLIPQASKDQGKVDDFKAKHDVVAPVYDKLGLFHVFSSVWFSAIYILLFISLIGCIVPRTWQFVGQLRGRPPGAPKRLTRLPAYTTWRTDSEPEAVREAALAMLRKRRFRAHVTGDAVASEKGFLRETGNLLFHIALIVLLVSFATGQLWKSEGGKLIVQGDGFSNTLTQYDDFTPGTLFDTDSLAPFSFTLDKFVGTYEHSGPNRGTPRRYEAQVTYSEGADGKEKKDVIKVNEPLEVDGSKVYLISHGYAPVVSVKDGRGKEVYRDAVPMLPLDSNATSTGAIKVMDGYRDAKGKKEQLGFNALFVPTYAGKGKGNMFSTYPGLDFPVMALSGLHGDLGVNAGFPQSVYQLNSKHMTPFKNSSGQKLAKLLLPGETMKLPNGAGSIQFVGVKQWASFQISHQPGNGFALAGALTAIAGLAGSLFIQRRRVWVRAVRGEDGVTVVEMAGLGRSESAKLPEELADLAATLHSMAPSAPDSAATAETAEGAEK
ncbi:cytochrome c biogenesis protein ResB [Streptomyces sp. NBC_00344]|uniref:cytochrome c biogenesis protein ResB n=1 Tax=Streptomyces sp. NBC_00344 TaxID=2975720 RepID=UPI002E1A8C3F